MFMQSNPQLTSIKGKIQEHIMKHDYSLEVIFKFLDKDKSNDVSIEELTRGLKELLTAEECRILFLAVDKDHSGGISYDEIITECSKINCGYVLSKMKSVLQGSKDMTPEKVFDLYDRDRSNKMEITEFNEMLNYLYEGGINKVEVDSLFKHFDSRGVGYITKEDFKKALTQPISLENKIETSLHDLLAPLKTKLQKMQLSF